MSINICILPQGLSDEADDIPKKFTNIDTEDFSQFWDGKEYIVKAGETGLYPKYLVNRMASNLARKIYKRQAYASFKGTDYEKGNASIRFVNPEEEVKLMKLTVAANFPEVKQEQPIMPTAETVIDKKLVEMPPKPIFKCEKCEFTAKSKAGLLAHDRRKHKKVEIPQTN